MNSKILSSLFVGASVLMLSACASPFGQGSATPITAAEKFPITVDQQTVTMTIAVDPSLSDLSNVDKARLSAFLNSYIARGHGPVTVTAPSGNSADLLGQEVASDVRRELYALGLPWDQMLGATYRVGGDTGEREVIVSYTRYAASASPCGDFSQSWGYSHKNLTSKNFGCATQANLAAMIVDPRDLVEGTTIADPDATKQTSVITAYQGNESTASATEASSEVSASE